MNLQWILYSLQCIEHCSVYTHRYVCTQGYCVCPTKIFVCEFINSMFKCLTNKPLGMQNLKYEPCMTKQRDISFFTSLLDKSGRKRPLRRNICEVVAEVFTKTPNFISHCTFLSETIIFHLPRTILRTYKVYILRGIQYIILFFYNLYFYCSVETTLYVPLNSFLQVFFQVEREWR